jgi:hypothetical protein
LIDAEAWASPFQKKNMTPIIHNTMMNESITQSHLTPHNAQTTREQQNQELGINGNKLRI